MQICWFIHGVQLRCCTIMNAECKNAVRVSDREGGGGVRTGESHARQV